MRRVLHLTGGNGLYMSQPRERNPDCPPSTMAQHFVLASSFLCDDDDDDDATGAAYRNPRPLRFRRDLCIRARMLGPNGDFVPATSARAAAKFAGAGRPRSHFVPIDPPRKL